VNWCANNDIGTLVIGYNKDWKRGINKGKEFNQKFVGIPFQKLISMIQYKSQLIGLKVILTEESYTSQCSFIDFESLELHDKYVGKRQHRGLFISREGIKINADCNGSGNIIRKVIPNAFVDGIQGVVVRPVRINPYEVDFGSKIP
jgi:putative transposase